MRLWPFGHHDSEIAEKEKHKAHANHEDGSDEGEYYSAAETDQHQLSNSPKPGHRRASTTPSPTTSIFSAVSHISTPPQTAKPPSPHVQLEYRISDLETQLGRAKNEKERFERRVAHMQDEFWKKDEEVRNLREALKTSVELAESAGKKVEELYSHRSTSESEVSELRNALAEAVRLAEQAGMEVVQLAHEGDDLSQKLAAAPSAEEVTELQKSLADAVQSAEKARIEVTELAAKKDSLQKERDDLAARLEEAPKSEEIEELQRKLQEDTSFAESSKQKVTELEKQLAVLEGTKTQEAQALRAKLAAAEARVAELEDAEGTRAVDTDARVEEAQKRLAEWEEQLREAKAALEKAEQTAASVSDLEKQIGQLTDEKRGLSEGTARAEELEGRIAAFEANLEAKSKEVEELRAERAEIVQEVETLKKEVGELKAEKEELQTALDAAQSLSSDLTSKLTQKSHSIANLEDELSSLQPATEKIESLENDIAEKAQTISDLDAQLQQLKDENQRLSELEGKTKEVEGIHKKELAELTELIEEKQRSISVLEHDISRMKVLEDETQFLQIVITEKSDAIAKLEEEIAHLKEVESRIPELESTLQTRTESLTSLEAELSELKATAERLPELEKSLADRTESLANLEKHLETLRADSAKLPELEDALLEREQSISNLTSELEKLKAAEERSGELERALGEKTQSLVELEEIAKGVEAAEGRREELERVVGEKDSQITELAGVVEKLKSELNALNVTMEETKKELEGLKSTNDNLCEALKERESIIESLHNDVSEALEAKTTVETNFQSLQTEFESFKQTHIELNAAHDELHKEREHHLEQLHLIHEQLDQFIAQRDKDVEDHGRVVEGLKKEHEQYVQGVLKGHEERISEIEKGYTGRLEEVKGSHDSSISELRKMLEEKEADIKQKESRINDLTVALDEAHSSSTADFPTSYRTLLDKYTTAEQQLDELLEAFRILDEGSTKVREEEEKKAYAKAKKKYEGRYKDLQREKRKLEEEVARLRGLVEELEREVERVGREGERKVGAVERERSRLEGVLEGLRESGKSRNQADVASKQENGRDAVNVAEGDEKENVETAREGFADNPLPFTIAIPTVHDPAEEHRYEDAIVRDLVDVQSEVPEEVGETNGRSSSAPAPPIDEMTNIMAGAYGASPTENTSDPSTEIRKSKGKSTSFLPTLLRPPNPTNASTQSLPRSALAAEEDAPESSQTTWPRTQSARNRSIEFDKTSFWPRFKVLGKSFKALNTLTKGRFTSTPDIPDSSGSAPPTVGRSTSAGKVEGTPTFDRAELLRRWSIVNEELKEYYAKKSRSFIEPTSRAASKLALQTEKAPSSKGHTRSVSFNTQPSSTALQEAVEEREAYKQAVMERDEIVDRLAQDVEKLERSFSEQVMSFSEQVVNLRGMVEQRDRFIRELVGSGNTGRAGMAVGVGA
ncbi:hypothetical protein HK097_000683 [Rhizophlyctis rosea]|uniref:Uncharacterized protein n=1 Tax=Rhizophlyctis rosea TaxID=64517 RepID=A0AAD5WYP8_9FUNG|nr:hypothetical protein HK097_000683 [Rhizophlyctis rosea]